MRSAEVSTVSGRNWICGVRRARTSLFTSFWIGQRSSSSASATSSERPSSSADNEE